MPKITFSDSDETIEVPMGESLLDACEEHGAPIPFGCTSGVCGTCICVLEDGEDQVNPIEDDEERTVESTTDTAGARLACQLVVNGDITIRSIG
jgi:ferredoxin